MNHEIETLRGLIFEKTVYVKDFELKRVLQDSSNSKDLLS